MDGSLRVGGREIDFATTGATVLNAMAEKRHRRPESGGRADPRRWSAGPSRRHELLLPGGHVTFGTGRSAFRHSLPSLAGWIAAHSDERGCDDGDQAVGARRPRSARALHRSRPGGGSDVLQGGRRRSRVCVGPPGHGTRRRGDGRRGRRLRRRRAAARLVEPRRRGPGDRRSRPPRPRASAARSRSAPSWRRSRSTCARWSSRSSPTRRRRSRCSASLGFDPEALLTDHVRDQSGELRDLMILAHSVEDAVVGDDRRRHRRRAVTTPRVDELLEAAVNGYEDVIRRSCELQRTLARALARPARSSSARRRT